MKALVLCAAVCLILSACSTPESVAHKRGQGTRQLFAAPYEQVWKAVFDACQRDELTLLRYNKAAGFISAKRGLRPDTFGENLAVWVTQVTPDRVQVEVVGRQKGPPVLKVYNMEKELLARIRTRLTAQMASTTPPR